MHQVAVQIAVLLAVHLYSYNFIIKDRLQLEPQLALQRWYNSIQTKH
jgi:hypothetical protein